MGPKVRSHIWLAYSLLKACPWSPLPQHLTVSCSGNTRQVGEALAVAYPWHRRPTGNWYNEKGPSQDSQNCWRHPLSSKPAQNSVGHRAPGHRMRACRVLLAPARHEESVWGLWLLL